MDERGNLVHEIAGADSLKGIQPQATPLLIEQVIDLIDLPQGVYRVLIKVPNSLPNGAPVRFANTLQDADAKGWLTLGSFRF